MLSTLRVVRRLWTAVAVASVVAIGGCGGGGGGGSGGGTGDVTVTLPQIGSFSAQPATISPGQSATLAWSVSGATSLSLDNGIGDVTGASSRSVSPGSSTTYVLTARNAVGSVTASTTVTVRVTNQPYPAGLSDAWITVGGIQRAFRVHVPSSLAGPPKAILLVLHGGGGLGMNVSNTGAHPLAVFRTVADREGFVVVYPGGLPGVDGDPAWNDCRSDNQFASSADDFAFLNALIERVRGEFGLDTSKVFLSGGSNGALMTLAYLQAGAGNVSAAATSNGNLPQNPKAGACSGPPTRRVPILMTHGAADPAMPYAGGCVANVGGGCSRGRVIGAEATRDIWLTANGLTTASPARSTIDLDTQDGGPANRFVYAGVVPVEWWRMDGGGHPVSSRIVLVPENAQNGKQNRDVEFAEIAWSFFNASLERASPPSTAAIQAAREYSHATGGQTFLVMHYGQVLDESYANGGAPERAQLLASATKGFTGFIGAIGAGDGLYALDEPVSQQALSEWRLDALKSQITYRHLLTMSSGLEELNDLSSWLGYLSARAINRPGEVFIYSGDPNIFGLALERRLGGESVTNYFNRKLFEPLGMASVRWSTNFADGRPQLSGGAFATARDWAKFGEFVRRTIDGSWSGPEIVARPLFEQVLRGTRAHPAYGFYWWLKEPVPVDLAAVIDANNKNQFSRQIKPIIDEPLVPDDFIMLAGAYGQRLYVIPSRGLTVIRNGPSNDNRFQDREFLVRLLARP